MKAALRNPISEISKTISADERNRRAEAFKGAKASVELEGFFISDELEKLAQSFIDGEIEFSEFMNKTAPLNSKEKVL